MLGVWGMHVDRPPNPLSIFNTGLDKRLGNKIAISHTFTPTIWDANKYAANNPFFNILTSIDIVLIFQGILSLLALIFAYDAIAGEYEHGTLRLVLSHPVGRGSILFAKYIGAMLCLLVPLLMSLLLMLILLTTSTMISLNTDDFPADRWDCSDVPRLSVAVLSHRHAHFCDHTPEPVRRSSSRCSSGGS